MADQWYSKVGGKQSGPWSSAELRAMAAKGMLSAEDTIRLGETGAWVAAGRVKGLFAARSAAPSKPPAPPRPAQVPAAPPSQQAPGQPPPPGGVLSPEAQRSFQVVKPIEDEFGIAPLSLSDLGAALDPMAMPGDPMQQFPDLSGAPPGPVNVDFRDQAYQEPIHAPKTGGAVLTVGRSRKEREQNQMLILGGLLAAAIVLVVLLVILFVVLNSSGSSTSRDKPKHEAQASGQHAAGGEKPSPAAAEKGAGGTTAAPQVPAAKKPAAGEPPPDAWTPADAPWSKDNITVRIKSVRIDRPKSVRGSRFKDALLLVHLTIANGPGLRKVHYASWNVQGYDRIKAIDSAGNEYAMRVFGSAALEGQKKRQDLAGGQSVDDLLAFPRPAATDYVRVQFPASAFGGRGTIGFEIPKSMIVEAPQADDDIVIPTPDSPAE